MKNISIFLMKSIMKIDPSAALDTEAEFQKKTIEKQEECAEESNKIEGAE